MREKDSELRGLISDFYNKYPNTEAILLAGASVVHKEFSSLKEKVNNYKGQYKDEFLQQLNPINEILNSALEREKTTNVRIRSSELLASILNGIDLVQKGYLNQHLALDELKSLKKDFQSLKDDPAFKALPEDERLRIESEISKQIFISEKILGINNETLNIDEDVVWLDDDNRLNNEDQKSGEVFTDQYIDEILGELDENNVIEDNQEINASSKETELSQPEKKESRVEQDVEDHIKFVEGSVSPKNLDNNLRVLSEDLAAYDENKSLVSQEKLQSLDAVMNGVGFGYAINKLDEDAKKAVRRKDGQAIENLEVKVTELQGQLERSRSDNSSQSHRSPYRKVMASILQVAINDLTRIKDFLKAARNELLNQTQNKRASTQILEAGPSKKTRTEARSMPGSQDVNIVIPQEKIINGISHFIEPHSIPVDITRSVHQYNQARDQLSKLDPSSRSISEIQEKLNNSRNSITSALGFHNELAVLEGLVNNAGTTQNKDNAKKLYDGASALSNVLEVQLDKLEKKQRTFEALGQKSPRLDAAADVINVSIIRLDQLKSQLVKHLPAKDKAEVEKNQFDFGNKNKR